MARAPFASPLAESLAEDVLERFLRYVRIDTQSARESDTYPSTLKQLDLSRLLADELRDIGLDDVELTQHGHDRAGPDRMRSNRLDERRQQKERAGREECPDQVEPSPLCGCAQADREQHEGHDAHSGEVVGEQCRRCESGEQCNCAARPHGPTW